jgi:hypothetical protein
MQDNQAAFESLKSGNTLTLKGKIVFVVVGTLEMEGSKKLHPVTENMLDNHTPEDWFTWDTELGCPFGGGQRRTLRDWPLYELGPSRNDLVALYYEVGAF